MNNYAPTDTHKLTKRELAFIKAKESGNPQVLKTWMADCNDPDEQCSLDHVTLFAMPDGTTKQNRMHTW